MLTKLKITLILSLMALCLHSQEAESHRLYNGLARFAVKSNLIYDIAGFNLGVETRLSRRMTLDISANYNPFTFSDNRKWKHILVQPELRFWTCESFVGHFFALHGHYAEYNVGNINVSRNTRDHRYRGRLAGGGVSYGYQWLLSDRWSMEAVIGFGYARLDYDKYECHRCGELIKKDTSHYLGPTKLAVSLIYVIK